MHQLLVNGGPCVQWLKLLQQPRARTQWLDYVMGQVEEYGEDQLRVAKQDRVLGDPDWRRVQALADLSGPKKLRRQDSLLLTDHAARSRAGLPGRQSYSQNFYYI